MGDYAYPRVMYVTMIIVYRGIRIRTVLMDKFSINVDVNGD